MDFAKAGVPHVAPACTAASLTVAPLRVVHAPGQSLLLTVHRTGVKHYQEGK